MMSVRIVFLGGLGEIGRNCFCLEVDGRILVVDCGIMFPDADMPGIDLVLPDFTYLRDNADRVEAVILTHAHEDHAGGLAFLLRDISVPIYGSALSLALARNRIEEAGMLDRTELIPVVDGQRLRIGPVECQFIPVTHSVPHGFAVAYFTPEGTIIHTGDFKLDLTPVDGRHTDLALMGELARREGGIRLLLSDSTNAERPGFTPSESTVGAAMRALFRQHPDKRFIVASFASHLHRVEQVAQAAISHGRKVAFVGRSMMQNVSMARERGFIDLPAYAVIDIEETARYAAGDVCIICTGSQGEPMSALSLMAAHEHKYVKVSPDDVVVISAHAIPGNESNVSRVIDSMYRAGAEVVHDRTSPVHVSGHASQEELKFVLSLLQPEWFIPVHGEYRHLVNHAHLAHEVGVGDDNVIICEDGDAVTITEAGAEVERRAVPAGYMYVDGIVGDVSHGVLRDRRMLSEEGVVVVIVTVDAGTGEIVTGPEIVTRGWVYAPEAEDLLEDAKEVVRAAIAKAASEGATDFDTMRRHCRKSLARFIDERTRRRPQVIPVVMEI
jgi:ribonuclease J